MEKNPAVPPHPNNSNLGRAIGCALVRGLVRALEFNTIVFFFLEINTTLFFLWLLVFPYKGPQFRVDTFSLSNFTNDSANISMAAQVQLTVRNPNTFVALSFGRTDANVYYKRSWRSLGGPTVLPPFSLGKKSQAPLTASFAAAVVGSNGNVTTTSFDLELLSSVWYKESALGRRRNHSLTVFCLGLVVGGPPRPCGVLVC